MSQHKIKLITTEDGSHSLMREDINETYHSAHGAYGESMHVFIKMGLEHLLARSNQKKIRVFEVGLGTGLNAFLSGQFARANNIRIEFHSIEPIPVKEEFYSQFNYGKKEEEMKLLSQIHEGAWEQPLEINEYFSLRKYETTLEAFDLNQMTISLNEYFDLIYFDAFAPSKQPEVWNLSNIIKCYGLLKHDGFLTCYSSQGQFKRNLKEAGFTVEKLPGALGKREMVRAKRP